VFKHDAVAECTVFGVEDERLGEEVGIAIVVAEGETLTADDVRAHCSKLLASFKIPRYIWLRTEKLPRNASGKFLKRELRDTLDPADAS
jgi:long-chain acyl-CoA synthetase